MCSYDRKDVMQSGLRNQDVTTQLNNYYIPKPALTHSSLWVRTVMTAS